MTGHWETDDENILVYHCDFVDRLDQRWTQLALFTFVKEAPNLPYNLWVEARAALAERYAPGPDDIPADAVTAWRVRDACLAVAASFVHPGPDGEDHAARRRLIAEWVDEGHEAVRDYDRRLAAQLGRRRQAEALLTKILEEVELVENPEGPFLGSGAGQQVSIDLTADEVAVVLRIKGTKGAAAATAATSTEHAEVGHQCARCGSTLTFEDCGTCESMMAIDSTTGLGDPSCPSCRGSGRVGVCLSTAEWCRANPLPGREDVARHTVEEFTVAGPHA